MKCSYNSMMAISLLMLMAIGVHTSNIAASELPDDLNWMTNDTDPLFASPEAKKGGTYRDALLSFPATFRLVGPDSNNSFAGVMRSNQLGLIGIHPNTESITPEIATHWAFGKDQKSMYFKLNPNARWSDGKPVTAQDFAYTIEFMRSEHIVAPWYNDYYTREIDKVVVYDDLTLAVVGTKTKPDLHMILNINPTPRHFFGKLDQEFVRKYNWKPPIPDLIRFLISRKASQLSSSEKETGGLKTCGILKIGLM